MILLRHGANPTPLDGGTPPVQALMEKLAEHDESKSYPYQLVSCLNIIILSISIVEMPFKVSKLFFDVRREIKSLCFSDQFLSFSLFHPQSLLCTSQGKKCSWRNTRPCWRSVSFQQTECLEWRSLSICASWSLHFYFFPFFILIPVMYTQHSSEHVSHFSPWHHNLSRWDAEKNTLIIFPHLPFSLFLYFFLILEKNNITTCSHPPSFDICKILVALTKSWRCVIRERLRMNCRLPDGIKELKIPRAMRRYVDLLHE